MSPVARSSRRCRSSRFFPPRCKPTNLRPTETHPTRACLQSFRFPLPAWRSLPGNQIILRGDDLPSPVPTLPRIRELIPSIERALLASSSQMKHAGDYLYITEVVKSHAFIACPLDAIRAGDALDHIVTTHDRRVLGIDKPGCQQAVECSGIPFDQSGGPLPLELHWWKGSRRNRHGRSTTLRAQRARANGQDQSRGRRESHLQ